MKTTLDLIANSFLDEEQAKHLTDATREASFRVGSGGIYLKSLDMTCGTCPRIAALRFMGIEAKHSLSSFLMMESGILNEEAWAKRLTQQGVEFLRESEVPTRWLVETPQGTIPVCGRPDFVLLQEEKKVRGLELKNCCSVWTARDALMDYPKLGHVVQAAHYSMALGIPFELWYTSRVAWYVTGWVGDRLPRGWQDRHYEIDAKNKVKKVNPFMQGYLLYTVPVTSDQDSSVGVKVHNLTTGESKLTIVTEEAIRNYYVLLGEMVSNDDPMWHITPRNVDVEGNAESYTPCEYCDLGLQNVCRRRPNTLTLLAKEVL